MIEIGTPGSRLRTAREGAGYVTAVAAAKAMKCPVSTYIQHENGTRDFSMKSALRYSQAFGVDLQQLMSGEAVSVSGPLEIPPEGVASDDRAAVFRERLAQRRDECGFNDLSLAKATSVNESYVRDILRGRVKEPTARKLYNLARVLQCSPAWLIGEDEPAPPTIPAGTDGALLRQAAAVLRSYGRDVTARELDDLAQIIARAQERVSK